MAAASCSVIPARNPRPVCSLKAGKRPCSNIGASEFATRSRSRSGRSMALPYKVATLLYCFNERDEVLLLERANEPNRGFWSPCGGKLHMEEGESPYACACREAEEELGIKITAPDLHLIGVVSEHAYGGQGHWLIFLFEVTKRLT